LTAVRVRWSTACVPRKNREKSAGVGMFVPCPGSMIVHEGWVFTEILLSPNGTYFTRCSCMGRGTGFIPWCKEGYGWHLWQVEAPPPQGWGGRVVPEISPPRRLEIESEYAARTRPKPKNMNARPTATPTGRP